VRVGVVDGAAFDVRHGTTDARSTPCPSSPRSCRLHSGRHARCDH
jgi:hypothetical protein